MGPANLHRLSKRFQSANAELRRSEAGRRASDEQARTILQTALDGVAIVDVAGQILEVNEAWATMLGYTVDEMTALQISDVEAAESPEVVAAHLQRLSERGGDRFETRHRRKDGTVIDVEVCVSVQPDRRLVSFIRDITERNRAQALIADHRRQLESEVAERTAALGASEQRWKFALEGAAQGVWDWDLQSHTVYYSPRYKAMLGYGLDDLGDSEEEWSSRLHPDDRSATLAAVERHFTGECPDYDIEFRMRRKDGNYAWIQSRGLIVTRTANGEPKRIIGTHTDITARKQAEEALRAMTQNLEAQVAARTAEATTASAGKSEFLAHMSHEIRTPMNVVLSLTRVLQEDGLTPEQSEVLRTIDQAGQSLLHIIDDILDFSKIEAGQLRIEQRPFELAMTLERVAMLLRDAVAAKGLAFTVVPPREDVPPLVGDALRLKQVLTNLLSNAIKFSDEGSVELVATVPERTANGARLRFEVRDTGIGIAPEARGKLFTPFNQAHAGITRRYGGTGLGLSICKRVVDLMGGIIDCKSIPGEGSTFWFEVSLPWATSEIPVVELPTTLPSRTDSRLAGLRVLVVDDNQMNLFAVERLLAKKGANVTLAADGQQAMQLLHAGPQAFDVVLMDIQMPVMDGLTATRAIRSNPALALLPVIALTAGVLIEEREHAIAAGVDDFLPKPLDHQQMIGVLSAIVEQRRIAAA